MSTESLLWAEVGSSDGYPEALESGLQSFLDYWMSLESKHGRTPRKSEFDPLDVARLWRGIAVIEVARKEGRANRFRYRFLGTNHDHVNGASHSGKFMDETLPEAEMAAIQPVYEDVIRQGRPHYWHRRGRMTTLEPQSYERVLTPFLGSGDRVDFLIGYWRWHWRTGIPTGLRLVHSSTRTAHLPPQAPAGDHP